MTEEQRARFAEKMKIRIGIIRALYWLGSNRPTAEEIKACTVAGASLGFIRVAMAGAVRLTDDNVATPYVSPAQ